MAKKNNYSVRHIRQSFAEWSANIHRFRFFYDSVHIATCVESGPVTFDDASIPEEVKSEVQAEIYKLMDKHEHSWTPPPEARQNTDAHCAEVFGSECAKPSTERPALRKGKKRYFKCICSYVEDAIEYWTEGQLYEFHKHHYGNRIYYDVKTNLDTWGAVGNGYLIGGEDIDTYFKVVWQ